MEDLEQQRASLLKEKEAFKVRSMEFLSLRVKCIGGVTEPTRTRGL
jgi:hypothetical protein